MARESTVPYVLPMPPPEKPPHPSMPKGDPAGDFVRIDPAEVARQLAALGVATKVDLLAARRQAFAQPVTTVEPQPAPAAEPEAVREVFNLRPTRLSKALAAPRRSSPVRRSGILRQGDRRKQATPQKGDVTS
jgi:hypothetical protein